MIITQLKSGSFQSVNSPTECSHFLKRISANAEFILLSRLFHLTVKCGLKAAKSQSGEVSVYAPHGEPEEIHCIPTTTGGK